MQPRTTGVLAILLLLAATAGAAAQPDDGLPVLDSQHFSREFAGRQVQTTFSVSAAGSFTVGRRAYLQIDLDTSLSPAGGTMPRAALINGFVSVALPPGLELDGQPRLQYYDAGRGRYEFMYSRAYPRLARFAGLEEAMNDATSSDRQRILGGLSAITGVLDPALRVSGPHDLRLSGGDPRYAMTGTSWLLPCNVMFHELVSLYALDGGLGESARLRVNVPLKLSAELPQARVAVFVGGLSAAVDLQTLLPEQIPPTAIPLVPLPEQPAPAETAETVEEDAEETAGGAEPPAEQPAPAPPPPEATEPELDSDWRQIGSDSQDEEPEIIGDPPPGVLDEEEEAEAPPPVPPAPIPTLVYSYEWLSWEAEIALKPAAAAEPQPEPLSQPVLPEPEIGPADDGGATPLVAPVTPPAAPLIEPAEEPAEEPAATPVTAEPAAIPVVVEPAVAPPPAEPPAPEPEPVEVAVPPVQEAGVRQVEPGTLPETPQLYTVPLKPITGMAADGGRPLREPGTGPDGLDFGAPPVLPPTGITTAGTYVPPTDLGEMILIPEGYFLMGTGGSASAGDADELPQSQVYLESYYIDKYPVTNRQFYAFVLSAGYKADGNWDKYFSTGSADLPVRGVTWDDATAYAEWAGKRLPTEAEWEKAARGEDGRTYPWGEDWSAEILPRGEQLYDIMHAAQCASPYGVMGMVGLVWQWTASAHQPYPFNPDARGDDKVLRGGAYSNGRNIVRCANRYSEPTNVALNTFSFRCARDAP